MNIFLHFTKKLQYDCLLLFVLLNYILKFDGYFYALMDLITWFYGSVICSDWSFKNSLRYSA